MTASEIKVELADRSYPIFVGQQIAPELPQLIRTAIPDAIHAVLISDANVSHLIQQLVAGLESEGWRVSTISIPSGEPSKSVDQLVSIWNQLLSERADRGTVVVAVGGGVVGDLAGFAAATFARGLSLVQVPTTLLSQVDSSVGGKTGINLPAAKNIVGAFWQPSLVVIDTDELATLPQREYLSGLAEIVKYGVILLPELFNYLELRAVDIVRRDAECMQHIIVQSCLAKASVVKEDERETSGRRAILNYGHTFAHAIEATEGYGKWLHGEAVSIGMHMAAHLACNLELVTLEFVHRQRRLLEELGLPVELPAAKTDVLWTAMQKDKKVTHGTLRFVLPTSLGHVQLVAGITEQQVARAIENHLQ